MVNRLAVVLVILLSIAICAWGYWTLTHIPIDPCVRIQAGLDRHLACASSPYCTLNLEEFERVIELQTDYMVLCRTN